jgi:8-oxo-dGTP diphosphatase
MAYTKNNKLHIVSVVAVIRNNEGKYLVLKRSKREIAYPGMYTFPGGKIEDNDTVEETLIKEAEEEASLNLKPGKILLKDKSFIRPDGQTVKVFSYLCEVENSDNIKISDDFTDYKWVSFEDLKNISHVGIEDELLQAEKLYKLSIALKELNTKSIKG